MDHQGSPWALLHGQACSLDGPDFPSLLLFLVSSCLHQSPPRSVAIICLLLCVLNSTENRNWPSSISTSLCPGGPAPRCAASPRRVGACRSQTPPRAGSHPRALLGRDKKKTQHPTHSRDRPLVRVRARPRMGEGSRQGGRAGSWARGRTADADHNAGD